MNTEAPPRMGLLRLADGRRLAYGEWGEPDGVPIIHQHGMPGSRLDHQAADSVYRSLGVRVITPDRPGYGLSDPKGPRTLLDWPMDVVELADQLGLGRFAVTALSGGGVYALACAYAIPRRITAVVTVGAPAPFQRRGAMRGMRHQNVVGLRIARFAPWLSRAVVATLAGQVRRRPAMFLDEGTHGEAPADRLWTTLPWVREEAILNLREAFRQGGLAYVQDINLLVQPWGFPLDEIEPPIQLWHGDADRVIPMHHALYLASTLPRATLRVCEGEGHMLLWNHVTEIVRAARGAQQPAAARQTVPEAAARAVSSQR